MEEKDKKQNEKEEKTEQKIAEQPKTEKEKAKKKKEGKKTGKTEAVVNAKDLPISTKHSMAVCNFIRNKTIDKAIFLLSQVLQFKMAVPMKGEIPHRKGNIMSGRYPIKACEHFLKLLRQLAANASVNEIDIEKARIECYANRASRPYGRFGNTKFKRTHVKLKVSIKKTKSNKK